MKTHLFAVLVFLVFIGAKCKKSDDIEPNGLPPATQLGKNTLGFLMNGDPWTPKGFYGKANLSLYYDPNFRGGVFNISAYRIIGDKDEDFESIVIACDSVQNEQVLVFGKKNFTAGYTNKNCDFISFDDHHITGTCTIAKLDKINRIFSGTFELTFTKENCKQIKVTQGRFDLKF